MRMKEIHDDIIYPLKQTFYFSPEGQEYFLQLVLCFVTISLEKRIQVELSFEDILFRLLLKTKKFLQLHQIVQNSILTDRLSVAEVLCELGSRDKHPIHEGTAGGNIDPFVTECLTDIGYYFYKPSFQLGIDMLYRISMIE